MAYTVTLSNGNVLTTIADLELNKTSSLSLLGRNYAGYGTIIANNLIHMLENAANATPPAPALTGQLWYNSTTQTLMMWNGAAWVLAGTAPNNAFNSGVTFQASFDTNNADAPANDQRYRISVDNAGEWLLQGINDDDSVRNTPITITPDGYINAFASPGLGDNSLRVATTAYVQNYAPLNSPALFGSPTAPTPAHDDNDASIATTAYVIGQAATTLPIVSGIAAVGVSTRYALADHVHPSNRVVLTAALNLYVTTAGNDTTGDGSIGNPWLTIQQAVRYIGPTLDTAGHAITVNIGNGTYAPFSMGNALVGGGTVIFLGNLTNAQLCKVVVPTTGIGTAISLSFGNFQLKGIAIEAHGTASGNYSVGGYGIVMNGSNVIMTNVAFGPCGNAAILVQNGTLNLPATRTPITVYGGTATGTFCISSVGAYVQLSEAAWTFTGTPTYVTWFSAQYGGLIYLPGCLWNTAATAAGLAHGQRYQSIYDGTINTGGGGATYLPGDTIGALVGGGNYV